MKSCLSGYRRSYKMRKFLGLMVVLMVLVFAGASFAQDAAAPVAPAEFTGIIEVTPADAENKEAEATIILDLGENAYKLIVTAEKRAELEAANGKTVTVKGKVIAASETHLMDSIEVAEWVEVAQPVEATTEEAVDDQDAPDAE